MQIIKLIYYNAANRRKVFVAAAQPQSQRRNGGVLSPFGLLEWSDAALPRFFN